MPSFFYAEVYRTGFLANESVATFAPAATVRVKQALQTTAHGAKSGPRSFSSGRIKFLS